jgi:hypothetical protein
MREMWSKFHPFYADPGLLIFVLKFICLVLSRDFERREMKTKLLCSCFDKLQKLAVVEVSTLLYTLILPRI